MPHRRWGAQPGRDRRGARRFARPPGKAAPGRTGTGASVARDISKLSQSRAISPAPFVEQGRLILENRTPRTSELLAAIASAEGESRILFGDLVAAMRNRAFGVLFLLFGI